ncbi:quinone-dependent dihydroorotate dehydrogenase [Synoicihabitans lomoniglobus]|uniref:Dihydroorotate dehydrogenase (quinone) n=1 Tax=Synoicihabitans lomoniglobus TaxID=2909285 RepID=A0AAF0CQ97_9BACT|nr:quinone-dependent dihydroorotate dehydrogenase [Opitutaceae bacterium LMO-M01]WED66085.1 quinone-dependent dihydroorotate dehydrogenase [Opitutaceae bacterium LMO-M01]
MDFLYEKWVRPLLFQLESERAHELGVTAMAALGWMKPVCRLMESWHRLPESRFRPVEAFGLKFPNTVGLAAGFDKNARAWPAAAAMGFGHVEIGTVTALAQPGNPAPRMFRYPAQEAVINRMGFNNEGADRVSHRLARQPAVGQRRIPLGVNLGKSKAAPLDKAVDDYLRSFGKLAEFADYLVLNVSSPNTPDLRKLQDESRLRELLSEVSAANTARGAERRPLLLKIAPDLSYGQIDRVLAVIEEFGFDGIIATNTTLARPGPFAHVEETGGLSGAPVRDRSTRIINYIARTTHGRLPIIGVGGITDAAGAAEKLDAGATLVQVYTGMIYRGPFFAAALARGLADRQRRY